MTEQEFWDVIELLDWERLEDGGRGEDDDVDPVIKPLIEALAMKSTRDITAFDDLLSEKLFQLDGELFVESCGVSGQYEDLFLYARCCVVANGQEAFETVKDSPELMPDGLHFDELLFVAERAWTLKTGREYDHRPAYSMEMRANKANWPDLPTP